MAFKGFREFLLRGNVIDLAVAVTVGTAFTAVVLAVTRSLLQPLVNVFLGGGVSGGRVRWLGQTFDFGAVINALISFAIIAALIYFVVVVPARRLAKPQPPAVDDETRLLEQIRDLLAHQQATGALR
jgi:large conductance mechanosensitive channel